MTLRQAIIKFDKLCIKHNREFGGTLVLCYFFDKDKTSINYLLDRKLTSYEKLRLLITKYKLFKKEMPLAKIFGYKYFGAKKIYLNRSCLIPRPETESMCELAISIIEDNNIKLESFLDLCCGSGCITSYISNRVKNHCEYTLVDIEKKAIRISKINNSSNSNFNYLVSNMLSKVTGSFDLVFFNPPYVSKKEPIDEKIFKWEDERAIIATNDGMYFYEVFFNQIKKHLRDKHLLFIEISDYVSSRVKEMCEVNFKYYRIINDDEGRARSLIISSDEAWLKKLK
jgi:release factor glutamine methyltransferase